MHRNSLLKIMHLIIIALTFVYLLITIRGRKKIKLSIVQILKISVPGTKSIHHLELFTTHVFTNGNGPDGRGTDVTDARTQEPHKLSCADTP
jgi:hypothetical protein